MKWVFFIVVVLLALVGAVTFNPAIEAELYGTTTNSKPAAPVGGSVF